ncbi:hypothetical protein ABZ639_26460 [Saccharomonospora sp. NPDC006951]
MRGPTWRYRADRAGSKPANVHLAIPSAHLAVLSAELAIPSAELAALSAELAVLSAELAAPSAHLAVLNAELAELANRIVAARLVPTKVLPAPQS